MSKTNEILDVIIEIPYKSHVKYEYDYDTKKMRCDRVLNTAMSYPGNYGYVPNTLCDDGDALDILMVCDYPLYPNTIAECKIIGVLLMEDEKGIDHKVIVVPSSNIDPDYDEINECNDLPASIVSKIEHFFKHYKDNDPNKWCKISGFNDSQEATKIYHESIKFWKKINNKQLNDVVTT